MAADILPNWLMKRADITPDRPAIEFEGITYSFAELNEMVENMAGKLAAKGVEAGDSCALLLRNHIDSVVFIHALFYLGVKIVMLNNKLTASELVWQVNDSEANYLFSEACFSEKLAKIAEEASVVKTYVKEQLTEVACSTNGNRFSFRRCGYHYVHIGHNRKAKGCDANVRQSLVECDGFDAKPWFNGER